MRYHYDMRKPRADGQLHVITAPETFHVDPQRGFLPSPDPLDCLPPAFTPWEEIAHHLPKLLVAGTLRHTLEQLPILKITALQDLA